MIPLLPTGALIKILSMSLFFILIGEILMQFESSRPLVNNGIPLKLLMVVFQKEKKIHSFAEIWLSWFSFILLSSCLFLMLLVGDGVQRLG